MGGDLHCHTKLSDGSLGIEDLIALAKRCGVDTIAIADHDCLAGTVRGRIIGERLGVRVIPGVELSAVDSTTGKRAHILGYLSEFPDRLEGLCHRNSLARKKAAHYMMLQIAKRFPVSTEFIVKCATGSTNIFPAHMMQALMECGCTDSLYGELYHRLFDPGVPGSIYVAPKFPDAAEVIDAVHAAGGIAQHIFDILREQRGVGFIVEDIDATQKEIVVIAGKSFKKPQQRSVDFDIKAAIYKLCGLDALDKPSMEVFVRKKSQKLYVVLGRLFIIRAGKHVSGTSQSSAVGMFKTAKSSGSNV